MYYNSASKPQSSLKESKEIVLQNNPDLSMDTGPTDIVIKKVSEEQFEYDKREIKWVPLVDKALNLMRDL